MTKLNDVIIIGAGTAGLSAFKEARKKTDKVLIIDHGPLGTTCARIGCMPSKLLIQAADDYFRRNTFKSLGIEGAEHLTINHTLVMQRVRELRDYFVNSVLKGMNKFKDHVINGEARFINQQTVSVNGKEYQAKSFILASGSTSIVPGAWQAFAKQILTNENIFEQKSFADNIAVIGLGVIGIELGQALARLDINVAGFGQNKLIGGLTDPIVNDYAINVLQQEFPLYLGEMAEIKKNGDSLTVTAGKHTFECQQLLASMGRKTNLNNLIDLEKLGIDVDQKGIPIYDRTTMQIKNTRLFFAGDANGERPVLHEAADEGRIAGFNAVQENSQCFKRRTPLYVTFSQPNIAMIGQTYHALQDQDIIIGDIDFADQGRARVKMQNQGLLRVYGDKNTGQLLGAEMIAPAGEHLSHLLAWAIHNELTVFDVLQMPYYHPVIEEGLRTALRKLASKVKKPCRPFELAMCDSAAVDGLV